MESIDSKYRFRLNIPFNQLHLKVVAQTGTGVIIRLLSWVNKYIYIYVLYVGCKKRKENRDNHNRLNLSLLSTGFRL